MDLAALQHLLSTVPGVRVACVGDLMIDRFVYGEVTRVSPEAPIPVLARDRELVMLGAAGNVARNVAALGGHVCLVGLAAMARAMKPSGWSPPSPGSKVLSSLTPPGRRH